MIDCSTGAGSARPVVSMTTRCSAWMRPVCSRSTRSASVSTSSPRTVQHRQPSESWMMPSDDCSTSRWSIATSPNSLMMTAVSASAGSFSSRLSSVVLPAPRKPVSTETGIGKRVHQPASADIALHRQRLGAGGGGWSGRQVGSGTSPSALASSASSAGSDAAARDRRRSSADRRRRLRGRGSSAMRQLGRDRPTSATRRRPGLDRSARAFLLLPWRASRAALPCEQSCVVHVDRALVGVAGRLQRGERRRRSGWRRRSRASSIAAAFSVARRRPMSQPSTTAISVRPLRVAEATRLKPDGQM